MRFSNLNSCIVGRSIGRLVLASVVISSLLANSFARVAFEQESRPNALDEGPSVALNGRTAISAIETAISSPRPLLCYYGSWAVYRPGNGKFDVEQIDPSVCTHIVYGFAGLGSDNRIRPLDAWNDLPDNWGKNAYGRFVGLKKRNPNLKALLAIGGWNEGSIKYSNMAADVSTRRVFITSVIELLSRFGFDGLDLDWEYPANRGGRPEDKQNFAQLLREMRPEFSRRGWLMTAAVSAGKNAIDTAYDVPTMSQNLDFINVMAYDYHGGWERVTGLNAPLSARSSETGANSFNNVKYSIQYWISKGASPGKLLLGIGTYGRSFQVNTNTIANIGDPASQPGSPGPYTREPGILGYNEICESMKTNRWVVRRDVEAGVPYAQLNRLWIGYDDATSVAMKAHYANQMGLAGAMIWSIETDDFRGICGAAFPLLRSIRSQLDSRTRLIHASDPTLNQPEEPSISLPSNDLQTEGSSPAPSTTKSDDDNFTCTKEGTFRHPTDCTSFIQCVNGESGSFRKFVTKCQSELAFDSSTGNCNWINQVQDCKR